MIVKLPNFVMRSAPFVCVASAMALSANMEHDGAWYVGQWQPYVAAALMGVSFGVCQGIINWVMAKD